MSEVTIFYADDDDDDILFFNEAISLASSQVVRQVQLHIHKSGENLLESIKRNTSKNKVVFLDINMELKNGFEYLEDIRNELNIDTIPIVMFTTSIADKNIQTSQNLGANFYAIKPNNLNDLNKMMLNVIQMNWYDHKADLNNFLLHKVLA